MLNEIDTRLIIAYDVLLTCSLIAHNEETLTKEQRDLLNRVVDDLERLHKERK